MSAEEPEENKSWNDGKHLLDFLLQDPDGKVNGNVPLLYQTVSSVSKID